MAIKGVTSHGVAYQGSEPDVTVKSVHYSSSVELQEKAVADNGKGGMRIIPKKQEEAQDKEAIKKAVEKINKKMADTECQYGIHEATNRVTIKIIDKESREVIREFPPEKTLEMITKAWELAGILVDEKR